MEAILTPVFQSALNEAREEGLQEGRMEEKLVMIAKMSEKNLQISVISEVTGLSKAQIKRLRNRSKTGNK